MIVVVQIELLQARTFPSNQPTGIVRKLVAAVGVPRQIERAQIGQVVKHDVQIGVHEHAASQIKLHQVLA